MFYDKQVLVLNENLESLKTIMVDLQPYDKTIKFDDEITIETDTRMFVDTNKDINDKNYIKYGNTNYKIMKVKRYDDFVEVYLYQLESEVM